MTGATAGFTANLVTEAVRLIKQQFKIARMPGAPVIVIDSNGNDGVAGSTMTRLLSELTGGAVSQQGGSNLSALGNELLSSGKIENIYGCMVAFTTFLPTVTRTVGGQASTTLIGGYIGDQAVYTVMKQGLEIKMGEKPGGLQMWLTGIGYFGSGAGDLRRGGAVNIQVALD